MAMHDWLYRWSEWGWPLVGNHLWQATLVTLLAAASAYCFRRGPARVRYGFWLLAAIAPQSW